MMWYVVKESYISMLIGLLSIMDPDETSILSNMENGSLFSSANANNTAPLKYA